MSTTTEISGAEELDVDLILDDRTLHLKCRPLTNLDVERLNVWVRKRYIKEAERNTEGMDPTLRKQAMGIAMRDASVLNFMSGYGINITGTPEGLAYLLWVMAGGNEDDIAKNRCEYSAGEITSFMYHPDNAIKCNEVFYNLQKGLVDRGEELLKKQKRARKAQKKLDKKKKDRKRLSTKSRKRNTTNSKSKS